MSGALQEHLPVIAYRQLTELLILSRESFEKLDREQPALANLLLKWLLNLLSARLRSTQGRLAAIF